ncbi:GNAT family N-acetyltransferase [Macrococcus lamae]|uniref:GNAT family N-acetyltransferase n=1 Tax=Macrococcus lamae TaxID=198484 RepID=A0A4V6PPS3_9STAP|nr:GNAT family N-acetyltransferase [Macrococcus lamae]TDM07936.1 GNAT family N-acetyltransferase [Macrococcus lamae]
MIEFRRLTKEDEAAFMKYISEWEQPDMIVPSATNYYKFNDFDRFLDALDFRESGNDWVKNTTLFLFVDGVIVGAGNIRHTLTEDLLNTGGHIGYGVGQSFRKQGYATEILKRCLEFLKQLSVERALVTCDEENIGSAQVILNNGGVEDQSYLQESGVKSRRFWIDIK